MRFRAWDILNRGKKTCDTLLRLKMLKNKFSPRNVMFSAPKNKPLRNFEKKIPEIVKPAIFAKITVLFS